MTSWPASVRRRVVALVETIAGAVEMRGGNVILGMSLEPLAVAEAQSLLPKLRERKAPAKRLPGESKAAKRERRRAEHREETARIRKAVFERAGGHCEGPVLWVRTANDVTYARCFRTPTELHHLEGGSGRRRQKQTVENCRAYCFECHRAAHRAGAREGA